MTDQTAAIDAAPRPETSSTALQIAVLAGLAATGTLGEALGALDARFPGLRFRIVDEQAAIRPHIKLFVDGVLARNLSLPMAATAELMIVGALSGG